MSVRIVPVGSESSAGNGEYLAVHTCHDPSDDTVTLATIRRVVARTVVKKPNDSPWNVKNLVVNQPMSVDAAVGFATCYAESKKIPVIFTETE